MNHHTLTSTTNQSASPTPTPPADDSPFLNNSIGVSAALVSFSVVGFLCLLIFCSVRTCFNHIYSPRRALRKGRPPRLPMGFLSWLPVVWTVKEAFILRTVGLDGVMFLRFLKTSAIMFAFLSVLGVGIIMPANYFSNANLRPDSSLFSNPDPAWDERAYLKRFTIENVPYNSKVLRLHLFFTWIVSFLSYACLIAFYRAHVSLKHHYTASVLKRTALSKVEHRTIMLFNLPRDLQQEVDLAAYFNDLEIGHVENVVVCRQWFKLREAVRKRMFYLQQLERIFSQCVRKGYIKNQLDDTPRSRNFLSPMRRDQDHSQDEVQDDRAPLLGEEGVSFSDVREPGLKEFLQRINSMPPRFRPRHRTGMFGIFGDLVDSAEFYSEKYLFWDDAVQELRMVPENSPCTDVAFVTFESPQSAVIASQIMLTKRPYACVAKPAPEPRDIYWPNLSSRTAASSIKLFRNFVMNSISVLIFLSSIMLAAFSSVVPSWKELPFLKDLFDGLSDTMKEYLSQVVPVVLFTAWTSCLPVLLIVICQLQGLEAESWIEQAVFIKYHTYQIINLLLYIAGLTIWRQLLGDGNSKNTILDVVGDFMPKASSPIICYVIIQTFAVSPAQLLHVGPLILTWLYRNSLWSRNSPRDVSDAYFPSLLTSLNYGISYTIPAVIWVIGLTYSLIAPLILPFCCLFFFLAYLIHKYILLYIHVPKYETGGMHVPIVVSRLIGGIGIFQFSMMGVLAIKYGGSWNEPGKPGEWSNYAQMVIGVLPLLAINFVMYWWLEHGYKTLVTTLPMEVLGKVLRESQAEDVQRGQESRRPHRSRHTAASPRLKRSRVFGAPSNRPSTLVNGHSSSNREQSVSAANHLSSSGTPTLPQHRTSSSSLAESYRAPSTISKSLHGTLNRRASERIEALMSIVSENPEPRPVFEEESNVSTFSSLGLASPQRRRASTISLIIDAPTESVDDEPDGIDAGSQPSVSPHLEPPSTRVPGILDAPYASGSIPKGDEQDLFLLSPSETQQLPQQHQQQQPASAIANDPNKVLETAKEDLQNYTYIHPALIGRLPIIWLDAWLQPETLTSARAEQGSSQRVLVKRIVDAQKAGVADMALNGLEVEGASSVLESKNSGVLASFVEGLLGWANMQTIS